MKGLISVDFFEKKGPTIESAPYCQILSQYSPYLLNDSRIW